ncbi:hypothetical protein CBFG_04603 [Clostridiales bacterium 1_7_47FAA]|nr:hypothetical protein CBFG_04603 [Clostridiales bacterium 1_7_47FAA]
MYRERGGGIKPLRLKENASCVSNRKEEIHYEKTLFSNRCPGYGPWYDSVFIKDK